jgi:hypothetical protein
MEKWTVDSGHKGTVRHGRRVESRSAASLERPIRLSCPGARPAHAFRTLAVTLAGGVHRPSGAERMAAREAMTSDLR